VFDLDTAGRQLQVRVAGDLVSTFEWRVGHVPYRELSQAAGKLTPDHDTLGDIHRDDDFREVEGLTCSIGPNLWREPFEAQQALVWSHLKARVRDRALVSRVVALRVGLVDVPTVLALSIERGGTSYQPRS